LPDIKIGDCPVIAGAVSGSAKQPENEAVSDRWLKTDTKCGISGIADADLHEALIGSVGKSFSQLAH
jgi:hypothetical protein